MNEEEPAQEPVEEPADEGTSNNNDYVAPTPTPQPDPTPAPSPTPQPEPAPTPAPQPETPSYTTPAGAFDGGLFNSKEDALAWIDSYTDNPDSEYYCHQAHWDHLDNGQWHAYILPYE